MSTTVDSLQHRSDTFGFQRECISRATPIQAPTDCLLTPNPIFGGWIQAALPSSALDPVFFAPKCMSASPRASCFQMSLAACFHHSTQTLDPNTCSETSSSIDLIHLSTFVGDNICRFNSLLPPLLFFTGWPQVDSGRTSQKIWNRSDQGECVCTGACLWATLGLFYWLLLSATLIRGNCCVIWLLIIQ